MMWSWDGNGWWWNWWFLAHGISSLLSLVVIIVVVIVLARILGGSHRPHLQNSPARTILEERYAKGEIDRDEYLQKKQDLGG